MLTVYMRYKKLVLVMIRKITNERSGRVEGEIAYSRSRCRRC